MRRIALFVLAACSQPSQAPSPLPLSVIPDAKLAPLSRCGDGPCEPSRPPVMAAVDTRTSVQIAAAAWGSYAVVLYPGSTYWDFTGVSFAGSALLTSGALTFGGGITTGSAYSAGAWTDGINLTPGNLDTNHGLQNVRSGARFTNGT